MSNEDLVRLYQLGNDKALDKLIEANKGIVNKIVNKFYTDEISSIEREDLVQEGYIGLMIAAKRYNGDMENSAKFITYAVHWIYSKIHRFVTKRNTNKEISLNKPAGDYTEDLELMDTIEDSNNLYECIEEKMYLKQLRSELEDTMSKVNTLREREILKLHNGWDTDIMTQVEIAELLGISPQRVRQVEHMALRKIRSSKWGRVNWLKYRSEEMKDFDYNYRTVEEMLDRDREFNIYDLIDNKRSIC